MMIVLEDDHVKKGDILFTIHGSIYKEEKERLKMDKEIVE